MVGAMHLVRRRFAWKKTVAALMLSCALLLVSALFSTPAGTIPGTQT